MKHETNQNGRLKGERCWKVVGSCSESESKFRLRLARSTWPGGNFVAEGFANLRDAKGDLLSHNICHLSRDTPRDTTSWRNRRNRFEMDLANFANSTAYWSMHWSMHWSLRWFILTRTPACLKFTKIPWAQQFGSPELFSSKQTRDIVRHLPVDVFTQVSLATCDVSSYSVFVAANIVWTNLNSSAGVSVREMCILCFAK